MKGIPFSFAILTLIVAVGFAQSKTRHVEIEVTLQKGAHPIHPLLQVVEGDTASVEIPNVGKFGFVPTVKASDNTTLLVDILDLSQTPPKKLDSVETSVYRAGVVTKTTPEFRIRASYIEQR